MAYFWINQYLKKIKQWQNAMGQNNIHDPHKALLDLKNWPILIVLCKSLEFPVISHFAWKLGNGCRDSLKHVQTDIYMAKKKFVQFYQAGK